MGGRVQAQAAEPATRPARVLSVERRITTPGPHRAGRNRALRKALRAGAAIIGAAALYVAARPAVGAAAPLKSTKIEVTVKYDGLAEVDGKPGFDVTAHINVKPKTKYEYAMIAHIYDGGTAGVFYPSTSTGSVTFGVPFIDAPFNTNNVATLELRTLANYTGRVLSVNYSTFNDPVKGSTPFVSIQPGTTTFVNPSDGADPVPVFDENTVIRVTSISTAGSKDTVQNYVVAPGSTKPHYFPKSNGTAANNVKLNRLTNVNAGQLWLAGSVQGGSTEASNVLIATVQGS